MSARPQFIVDCGGHFLTALLLDTDGRIIPCSEEIRQVATRYVPADVHYAERASDGDLLEETIDSLGTTAASQFFKRARRAGLRRSWDAEQDALRLASPLSVLSSPAALADTTTSGALVGVSVAMLDALFDPLVSFLRQRHPSLSNVDALVVVPAHTGRAARLALHKIFRRRGFRALTILRREVAAALAFVEHPPRHCEVWEMCDDNLHLHRVAIDADGETRRLRTERSETLEGLGWTHWVREIARALEVPKASAVERALISLLSGSSGAITRAQLQVRLDADWQQRQARELALRASPAGPAVVLGEICGLDPVHAVFGGTTSGVPVAERAVRGVAEAISWLRQDPSRSISFAPSGTLRVATRAGEAVELLPSAQLPAPGDSGYLTASFRFAGAAASDKSFLLHLLWGSDRTPEGNATLCAVPIEIRGNEPLHLRTSLRRSRTGRQIYGTLHAHTGGAAAARPVQFTEEIAGEVTR